MPESPILQIALASGPIMITVLVGILVNNARMSDLRADMTTLRSDLTARIDDLRAHVDTRFTHVDHRFDEMRSSWTSKLRRVEEVLEARLKHLEER